MKLVNIEQTTSLADLLDDAQHERIVVERDGQPIGVILSMADYQDWTGMTDEELSALFASPELQAKIQRANADDAAGRSLSHAEVGARLQARSEQND
jgi:PHD/YefM family antitoxin component YafN of YafNO toxin-antitoxin module